MVIYTKRIFGLALPMFLLLASCGTLNFPFRTENLSNREAMEYLSAQSKLNAAFRLSDSLFVGAVFWNNELMTNMYEGTRYPVLETNIAMIVYHEDERKEDQICFFFDTKEKQAKYVGCRLARVYKMICEFEACLVDESPRDIDPTFNLTFVSPTKFLQVSTYVYSMTGVSCPCPGVTALLSDFVQSQFMLTRIQQ